MHDLDLSTILYQSRVLYPWRSELVGQSNHLRPIYTETCNQVASSTFHIVLNIYYHGNKILELHVFTMVATWMNEQGYKVL